MHALTRCGVRTARKSFSPWSGPGLARKIEHALFAVTLVALAYLCLGPVVEAVWI